MLGLLLAQIDGLGFDPFFRGLLSVLVGVVVLFGSVYLLVATNSGWRVGGLIAGASLFGWMSLMGIIWTAYGIGWVGEGASWHLVEIVRDDPASDNDGLVFAENPEVQELGLALESYSLADQITEEDPDLAQAQAYEIAKRDADELEGWRYLTASNPVRGEAQSTADEILVSEHIFDSTGEYLPLAYGAYNIGGKTPLPDDPTVVDRVWNKFTTLVLQPLHPEELLMVQVQGTLEQPTLPGQAPPVATIDPTKPVYNVLLERDRGGPVPSLVSGLRFTPLMFTVFNGLLFAVLAWNLHVRDQREEKIRAEHA